MPQNLPIPEETPIDLTDTNRWTLKFQATLNAVGGEIYFDPIPEQFPVTVFSSPVIAVQALTTVGNSYYVASLKQYSEIGTTPSQISILAKRSLYVGVQTLFFRQDLLVDYRLRIKPYSKLNNLTLVIYEFL